MSSEQDRVGDIMDQSFHTINGLAKVKQALALMKEHNIGSLVVERRDDDDEFGLVTVRDIADHVIAKRRSIERVDVYEIMAKPGLTITKDMHVKYAIRLLAQLGRTRALVSGAEGLEGLVTLRDLVLAYKDAD